MREYQDKDILNHCNYNNFKSFLEEIKKMLDQQSNNSTNFASNNPNYKILTPKEFAQNIRKLNDGSFKSDGKKVKFDRDLNPNKEIINYYKKKYINHNGKNLVSFSLTNNTHLIRSETIKPNIETIYHYYNLFILKNGDYIIYHENRIYCGPEIIDPKIANNFTIVGPNLFEKEKEEEEVIGVIKINDDFIAFTSNGIPTKREKKLSFYNTNSKKFLKEKEIKNYSFIESENNCSLMLMNVPKSKDNKLLLVACKKYTKDDKNDKNDKNDENDENDKNDKNGILVITLQFNKDENDIEPYKNFHDTGNFEVHCICPIYKIENKDFLDEDKTQKIESEYFLVGGYDPDKDEVLIKLYKVIYSDEIKNTKIEFIQDNIIEKMEGQNNSEFFKRKKHITCIEQTSEGEILVVIDENVYLFSAQRIKDLLES